MRGPYPDRESAYAAQGEEDDLLNPDELLTFSSLGRAKRYLRVDEGERGVRGKDCFALLVLARGHGFAMLLSSWEESTRLIIANPDVVIMLFSDPVVVSSTVKKRRDMGVGITFDLEANRQARRLQGRSLPEDSMPSSLAGLVYQHDAAGDFDLGPLMDRTRELEWTPLDLAEYFQSLEPDEAALVQGQISSMGLDGYQVCPVYRYNTRLDRYEYSSIAPVCFSDPG